jgi:hypothetical protein
VDNNYLDLGMNKSGFVHTLPSGRLNPLALWMKENVLSPKNTVSRAESMFRASSMKVKASSAESKLRRRS